MPSQSSQTDQAPPPIFRFITDFINLQITSSKPRTMARLAALFLLGLFAFEMALSKRDHSKDKDKYEEFKKKHGKNYNDPREHSKRFNIFSSNLAKVEQHNKEYLDGQHSFNVGVNKFSDMTDAEKAQYRGYRPNPDTEFDRVARSINDIYLAERMKRQASPPVAIDWRNMSAVSPVKNQQQCGSCWTFSTTGVLESAVYIKKNTMIQLSEQNLVDCVPWADPYWCGGCSGGDPARALQYIMDQNNQIDTETSYPYEGSDNDCRFNAANDGFALSITSIAKTKTADENALKTVVGFLGPVTAVLQSCDWYFMHYTTGVFNRNMCDNDIKAADHAVLIVGYGTDPVQGDYWIVKNSWDTTWGEQGYIRLGRNKNNTCGIANDNRYPFLA